MASKRPPLHQASDLQELLLHSKASSPATPEQIEELRRVSKLDVSQYSEADVRAEIIDPVIRILGYQKETYFSLQREKSLKVLDGDLFIDYSMTLWTEAFWLIEAKKVKRKPLKFIPSELQQALQYAAHPSINAALVVLCDGRVFEVYDREESVSEPAVRVEVKKLPEQFHLLQALLSPWQSWFYQKRRVLRLVDKVLDQEMIPDRLKEFRRAVERRLEQKHGKIVENWRRMHPISLDRSERESALRQMSTDSLIEAEFFIGLSVSDMNAVGRVLLEKARPGGFDVMYSLFPDEPRAMNDYFVGAALRTLIEFDAHGSPVTWFPTWLEAKGADDAIKRLIHLGLTTFNDDPQRKMVLQYSACARRTAKLSMALIPELAQTGQRRHEFLRHQLDELHQVQAMSTPAGHNIRALDGLQVMLTTRFVTECRDERNRFSAARAETMLQDAWQAERTLLGNGTAYWTGVAGRDVQGEINPTEHNWVDYDNLGHLVLCVLANSPEKWREYALESHETDVHRLARGGSWQARKLLNIADDTKLPPLSDEEMAGRFFAGNLALYRDLSKAYMNRAHVA